MSPTSTWNLATQKTQLCSQSPGPSLPLQWPFIHLAVGGPLISLTFRVNNVYGWPTSDSQLPLGLHGHGLHHFGPSLFWSLILINSSGPIFSLQLQAPRVTREANSLSHSSVIPQQVASSEDTHSATCRTIIWNVYLSIPDIYTTL